MLVEAIMTKEAEWLSVNSTAAIAENLAFEHEVFHLPLSNEGKLLGVLSLELLSEEDIEQEVNLGKFKDELLHFSVPNGSFVFDILRLFSEFKSTALPVVDELGNLVGILKATDVIDYLSKTLSIMNPGSFITLKLETNDYNLQEISRIVESNNAQIISLHFEPFRSENEIHCTLKINQRDLKHILATFERFDYDIIAHSSLGLGENELKQRYDELMKYLNI